MSAKPPPSCPRCGYDQTGVAESWTDSCPLTGVCSECGLGFEWHDIMCADLLVVRGFVEHAAGFRRLLGWAWITWLWTLWPPIFWRRVRMEHAPRMPRCVLWLAILLLPLHAIVATVRDAGVWRDYLDWCAFSRSPTPVRGAPPAAFKPATIEEFPWGNAVSPWCEPLLKVEHGPWWQRGRRWLRVTPHLTEWPHFVPPIAAISFTVPVILLALPVTRRLAKVRAGLILRSAIYGCAWIVLPSLSWVLSKLGDVAKPSAWNSGGFLSWYVSPPRWVAVLKAPYESLFGHPLVWLCALIAWTTVWWRRAILTMFQGHSPRSVMAAAFTAAGLSALVLFLRVPEFLEWVVSLPGAQVLYPPKPLP